jgi:uncharacterized protein YigA (DUF484 family)
MSEQPIKRELSPLDVAAFLRRNPDFLTEFPDLALVLKMPRQLGDTTSLASYQLDVLREKNRALNRRLQELVAIATENEQLVLRVHALTLTLMRAGSLDETLRRVVATLNEDLASDLVRIVLFQAPLDLEPSPWLAIRRRDDAGLREFAEFFARGEPLCGRLNAEKLDVLFSDDAARVKSTVLLPIAGRGLLAVGSTDANRFHPGMGTLFVKLIADAVAAALARFDPGAD